MTAVTPGHHRDGFALERYGSREQLARALHGVYVNAARDRSGHGRTAVVPFEELSAADQARNREQAADVPRQLEAVLWRTKPLKDWDELGELPRADVEVMAQLEHWRWAQARTKAGWRYGPEREESRKRHPDLVPWSRLTAEAQRINLAFVEARPALLGRIGRGLEPDPVRDALAMAVNERYRAHLDGKTPSRMDWSSYSDDDRELSRALVARLPSALIRIDRRIVTRPSPIHDFDDAEVELLARSAHASWVERRSSSGWVHGHTRQDAVQQHPDILPWNELSEARREIDRMLVRSIPLILSHAGLGIVRLDKSCWEQAGSPLGTPEPLEALRV